MKLDEERAVDFFKHTLLGSNRRAYIDGMPGGFNYRPSVLFKTDLPDDGQQGDIIEVKKEGKFYTWYGGGWFAIQGEFNHAAPPALASPNSEHYLVSNGSMQSKFDALSTGQGLAMTDNCISLDTSLQKIIENSQKEIEDLRKELHELKAKAFYGK